MYWMCIFPCYILGYMPPFLKGSLLDPDPFDSARQSCIGPAGSSYLKPVPMCCSKFIVCSGGGTILTCPAGTNFSPLYQICVWSYQYSCIEDSTGNYSLPKRILLLTCLHTRGVIVFLALAFQLVTYGSGHLPGSLHDVGNNLVCRDHKWLCLLGRVNHT